MPRILILDLSTASSVPVAVRAELKGKLLTVYNQDKITVIAQPTVGTEEAVERYEQLRSNCYAVCRQELWDCAIRHSLPATMNWIDEMYDCTLFLFEHQHCRLQV